MVRAGTRALSATTQQPVTFANGTAAGFGLIGGRTGMAAGYPMAGRGCPPIGSGVPVAAHSIIASLIGEARRAGGVTRSQANQKPQLSRDVVSGVVGHSFRLVRFPFVKGGRVSHRWADATWRQEREARPVLVDPAISNVDRYAEPMGEVAGSAG